MVKIQRLSKICEVTECDKKVVTRGLCDMHRKRLERHGHLDATRPNDWGKRENHPLYGNWGWMRRSNSEGDVCDRWSDFWNFVEDVKKKPGNNFTLRRVDSSKSFSPENYQWVEILKSNNSDEAKKRHAEYSKTWSRNNPEKVKNSKLKKSFGITYEDYSKMYIAQDGKCAICSKEEKALNYKTGKIRSLAVDHCHKTGKVRGLLCSSCNKGIGCLNDDIKLLDAAKEYLNRS